MFTPIDTKAALKYFKVNDPIMASLLSEALKAKDPVAIPQAKPVEKYFESIVRSIISQQISVKAAEAVFQRVFSLLGEITPTNVLKTDPETLKYCGLSYQKTKYIFHNAKAWPEIPFGNFGPGSDEDIITELTKLYGIGRWSAEMFLMFSMARPDVFSYGDLGLMKSLYEHYSLKPHYKRKIKAIVDNWAPHRTTASLALWYHRDKGPVLL